MMAPISVGMLPSFITLLAGIAMYSANAPSRSTPMIWVRSQTCPWPVRQGRQCPQMICPSAVTLSPTWRSPAPFASTPISAISPANSCPITTGGLSRPDAQASHSQMWRSVPQTPACRTRMRTSFAPILGVGTSFSVIPTPALSLTSAFILGW